MENSIVRGAIKGMIKDSETIDKLVELLDCDRVDVGLQVASLKDKNGAIATIDEMKTVLEAIESAESSIADAKYDATETSDQADNCKGACESATDYLYDVEHITSAWWSKIKDIKDAETMLDAVEKKAPAKKVNTDNQD